MSKLVLNKSNKDNELYYYFNSQNEKLWMFRHKYYDLHGKRKEKKKSGFKSEKEALKALLEVKAQTLRGNIKGIENEKLTISQWVDIWFEVNKKNWSLKTTINRESVIRLQIKPLLGHYRLQSLDRVTYQREFIEAIKKRYAPSHVKVLHTVFKIAINAAVEEEILDRNRFNRIKLTLREEKNENFLSPEQLVTLLRDAKENDNITNFTMLLVVAYTGMRCGEVCGLKWSDIDFTNNTITIARSRGQYGVGRTKTKNSERTIPVDKLVLDQLKLYKKWCIEVLFKFGDKLNDKNGDKFIFISKNTGLPICTNNSNISIKRVIQRTGIPKITLHGLRHTHATILLNDKIPVKVIADRLGNTPQMIHTVYGHVLKEMEQQTVEVFSNSLKVAGAKSGASI